MERREAGVCAAKLNRLLLKSVDIISGALAALTVDQHLHLSNISGPTGVKSYRLLTAMDFLEYHVAQARVSRVLQRTRYCWSDQALLVLPGLTRNVGWRARSLGCLCHCTQAHCNCSEPADPGFLN